MKAFNKDIVRSIRHSLGRFVAIAAIVALGCGFYAGLRMTAPDMKLAADAYYDGTDLMDIRVVSTLGLTDEDIEALRDVPGVSGVEAAYSADVLATLNDEQYVMRVHSLSPSAATVVKTDAGALSSDDANYLNRLDLVEGRWPTSANECVIFNDRVMSGPSSLGDTVTVDPSVGNVQDTLAETEFTVVGRVHSPLYVSSTSMGTSTIGSGTIEQFMYVLPEAFDADMPYVEAYVSVEGAAELPADSDAYDDRVAGVVAAIEGIAPAREQARVDGLKAEAQADLDEARAEYEKEEARAKTELADARAELDAAKEELDEGQRKLDAAASTLAANEKKIKDGEKEYTQGTDALSKRKADAEAQFAEAEQQIAANEANLAEANAALPTLQDALAQAEAALQVPNLPAEQRAELEATRADLEQKIADIAAAATALEEAKAQLAQERASADAQIAAAQAQLDQAKTSVEEGKKQLEEGKAEYEQGKADLEAGRAEYEQGVADYDAAAAEANEELDKAEQELADAQKEIDDIEPPDWLVMDRTKNFGVVSFASDADRIDAIASFFPFIFFLVAALVALTTMTRMVEDDRMLIGTLKALGYSKRRIAWKYVAYGLLASVIGCVVGVLVLSQLLPLVIMTAYGIVYFVPQPPFPLPIDPLIAGLSAAFGIGVTLVATAAAAWVVLAERPAALMLPPAPKAGRRILLERVSPVWKRLSFSWKVTLRNMFRYKKRLFMTIVGIAGCTALLLTGLGISDAINDIIDKQFGELTKYNLTVTLDEDASQEDVDAVDALLADDSAVEDAAAVLDEPMLASGPDATDVRLNLVVPEDPDGFAGFFTLRNRLSQEALTLGQDGCLVSEKLAQVCGVVAGDSLTLTEQDSAGNPTSATYRVPVTGIVENYIGYDVFMGPDLYEETFGKPAEYSTRFVIASDNASAREELLDRLQEAEAVKTAAFNDETIETYRSMLASVNLIVVVLVVSAALLAFIVLYNLTNINISERSREIATLKVLGFLPRETNAYIFREIFLLAAIGALVGLVLGMGLESFVVLTAEVDGVMFGRQIHLLSFVLAFVLTMVFTWVSMLAMKPKIARIDMVESLKSNE
ncbi:FtsX-like permease family protein [Adlercreutzia sp.]|uniref:FtsX-like permease family protein n=1 Tax=Adlercreutzia sp. TaxID=1872387 RepID=UPI003AF13921